MTDSTTDCYYYGGSRGGRESILKTFKASTVYVCVCLGMKDEEREQKNQLK